MNAIQDKQALIHKSDTDVKAVTAVLERYLVFSETHPNASEICEFLEHAKQQLNKEDVQKLLEFIVVIDGNRGGIRL